NHEARALANRRFDINRASVRLDNTIADTQAKSRPFALGLRGEERIKDLLPNGGIDAAAGVGHKDFHGVRIRTRSHGYFASRWTGIDGVAHQVEHDLVDLGRITT